MAATSQNSTGRVERPLSPHVQVWRWHVTMATSITHRMSGVGNALGACMMTWWLVATASGPEAYAVFAGFLDSLLGRLILFGFTASLIYHVLNGIRHLVWDTGAGFALGTSRTTGLLVYLGAVVITLGIWAVGYGILGGA